MTVPKDFYARLGVARDCDDDALKKAYKKMAMKTHPDRKGGNQEDFKRVAEAYDCLSDANKRAVYDRYGEDGLKQGFVPPEARASAGGGGGFPGAGPGPGFASAGGGGFPGAGGGFTTHEFSNEDAERMFKSFFGGMGGGMSGIFGDMGGGGGARGAAFGGAGGGGAEDMDWGHAARKRSRGECVVNLECTLEELYTGTQKRFTIKRQVNGPNGMMEKDETITVDVVRGWKDGTRLTYQKLGHEVAGQGPESAADLVVVIKEAKHRWFKREKDNLIFEVPSISLRSALVGFKAKIPGIDGVELEVAFDDCTEAGSSRVVRNKGMINSRTGARGDVIVKIQKVTFPKHLTEKQKTLIKQAFSTTSA